jgi:hypothetical protein
LSRQEVLNLEADLDYNEALIVEREEGIRDIQGQILEVHETFKDLAQLVQEQGSSIGEQTCLRLAAPASATRFFESCTFTEVGLLDLGSCSPNFIAGLLSLAAVESLCALSFHVKWRLDFESNSLAF